MAISPDFRTQWAVLSNFQIEQALGEDVALSLGYINSSIGNMPVLMDRNLSVTNARLGDGRPVYSSVRPSDAFNSVDVFESIGSGDYNAFTITLSKRMRHGWQMQANYTLAKSTDNAPLPTYVLASGDDRVSDFSDLDRDKGPAPFDQKHTFAFSSVFEPKIEGALAPIVNNNQVSVIVQANSGLPFNVRTNRDLNGDGNAANDRPLGVERNAWRFGTVFNVDARYSRFLRFGKRRLELFGEAKNLLNRLNVSGANRIVATDAAGNPTTPLPTKLVACGSPAITPCATAGYDQRSLQFGAKVWF